MSSFFANTVLKNKTIIITGATSGLGYEMSLLLARNAAHLVLVGRNKDKLIHLARAINTQNQECSVSFFVVDLCCYESVKKLVAEVKDQFLSIDVVVNNAASFYAGLQLSDIGVEKTFFTNYLSHFYLTLSLLPLLNNAECAQVVNISSASDKSVSLDFDYMETGDGYDLKKSYAMSKLAMSMFTIILHEKFNLISNSIHPGKINTNIGYKNTRWYHKIYWSIYKVMAGSTKKSASFIVDFISENSTRKVSGMYFSNGKVFKKTSFLNDVQNKERLYRWSLEKLGINDPLS